MSAGGPGWCAEALDRLVSGRPGEPAVVCGRRRWTYAELGRMVARAAGRLIEAGATSGAWVRIDAGPTPGGVVLLHAAWRAGAAAMFTPPAPGDESDVRPAMAGSWVRVRPDPAFERDPGHGSLAVEPSTRRARPGPDVYAPPDAAAGVLTSGTEGDPRVVPVSTGQLAAVAVGLAERLPAPALAWGFTLHPSRIGGLSIPFRTLRAAGSVVCLEAGRWDAAEAAETCRSGQVSHLSVAPVMLRDLSAILPSGTPMGADRPVILVGGAPCPEEWLRDAQALNLRVATTWGMSETAAAICVAPPELVARDAGTVGPPLRGSEVRVGEGGELHVRGPQVFGGYLGSLQPPTDADGWYATGDVGSIDAAGNVRLEGRKSRRIITGGVNVEPAAVEAALLRHPGVEEVCVFGEADPVWGERVVAVITSSEWDESAVATVLEPWCRENLSSAHRPRRWVITGKLPRTAAGKLDHRAVAGRYRQREGEG